MLNTILRIRRNKMDKKRKYPLLAALVFVVFVFLYFDWDLTNQQNIRTKKIVRDYEAESLASLRKQVLKLEAENAVLKRCQSNVTRGVSKSTSSDKRLLNLQPDPSLALFDGVLNNNEKQYRFTGQFREDSVILSTFFRNFRNGFFVELGAMDGITFSNTFVFQEQLGWKGVLIEPSGEFGKLRVSPRCLNGGSICLNLAICDSWKTAEFVTGGHAAVGGLQETMTRMHEKVFFKDTKKVVKIPCGPMGDVLKFAGVKRIDFFSIDVEGAEVYIVETMDWINIPVHVVMIERPLHAENTERIDNLMLLAGFRFFGNVGRKDGKGSDNVVWVNPDNARPADTADSFK